MQKSICFMLALTLVFSFFTGCANGSSSPSPSLPSFDTAKEIRLVSREDGSGTNGAFIELFGIKVKGDDGSTKNMTTKEAVITNQTSVMMTNITGDKYAIGYISLGSLNHTVKAIQIEGIDATAENVKNGTYPITRPFNIATKGESTGLTRDFIDFIMSTDGQALVAKAYISINDSASIYTGNKLSGKIVVAGSSSVSPIMEKLREAYLKINPNATIEIQESDSSAGMTAVMDETCDIGMASRELKESERAKLTPTQIAIDGIVLIINNDNPLTTLTKEQVRSVYMGETVKWSEISK